MAASTTPQSTTERKHGPDKGAARRSFGAIRQRAKGKPYEASYVGPDAARHRAPSTFDTRDAAVHWLEAERRLIERDTWTPPADRAAAKYRRGTLTVGEYAREWVAGRELRPTTAALYARLLNRQLLTVVERVPPKPATATAERVPARDVVRPGGLENVLLAELTRDRVRAWYKALGTSRPRQRAAAYALLSSVALAAVEDGHLTENPVHIRGAGSARRVHQIEPATLAELDAIRANMPERLRLAVALSSWCALRAGETFELRRGDVDIQWNEDAPEGSRGVVHVTRAVSWAGGRPVVGPPKTDAGRRAVAIPPHLLPEIREHLRKHAQIGARGLLFYTATGGHVPQAQLWRVFDKARTAAGRPDLRWHDLRHTGAVLVAQSGATLRELQSRLGHTTAAMSLRYQHVAEGRDQLLAERLSDRAAGRPS